MVIQGERGGTSASPIRRLPVPAPQWRNAILCQCNTESWHRRVSRCLRDAEATHSPCRSFEKRRPAATSPAPDQRALG
ncbi:hypothetical protein DAPPUDRAFT_256320 [Daphnia pulex]|uniref:Uncharacterized protein n=1 Tax=Daphnia pulex TaxID=6669 RepID=E9HB40_DAPPU|nr:hypothetical protein DAPPUDRAFT_256320 [Daphnia pulex]|eukprot:EFX71037.1 hypothetical protein DAPPUDRAFT_256320 [Daphnia pulex]